MKLFHHSATWFFAILLVIGLSWIAYDHFRPDPSATADRALESYDLVSADRITPIDNAISDAGDTSTYTLYNVEAYLMLVEQPPAAAGLPGTPRPDRFVLPIWIKTTDASNKAILREINTYVKEYQAKPGNEHVTLREVLHIDIVSATRLSGPPTY